MNALRMARPRARRLLAIASAVTLMTAALAGQVPRAEAQAPLEPRAANTCQASLTVFPDVVLFGGTRPVSVTATGLEPGVSYRLYFNNALMASGSVDLDGAVHVSTTVESQIALRVDVQVVTASRCAAGTLLVAGPRFVNCVVVLLDDLRPFCILD